MAFQTTMLALEAQQVIALRLTKMALSTPATQKKEAALMVSEKIAAMGEGGRMMMAGAATAKKDMNAGKVVRLYRGKVRANRRRLSK
jgi:hypothetical protein